MIMNLTDFASVGIVIILVISLFVSKCSSSMFLQFLIAFTDRCPSVGSGFSTGEYLLFHQEKPQHFLTLCRYENCAWAPSLLVFVITTGVGGKHFVDTPTAPATAAQIFSFGATIAGYTLAWASISADYTVYFHPRVSRFVEFRGGLQQSLIPGEPAGESSHTRIWALISLQ